MEPMNILIAINDNFAKYAVVLLNSLYSNHKDMQIDTYILYVNLSKNNIKLIDDFAKMKQQKTIFIDANRYIDQINEMSKNISVRLGKETYLRLFAPDLLPVNINRYLYLDTDIVVNKNISEFYYQDFLEACIVSPSQSLDYIRVQSLKRNLSAAMKSEYFNAGVILFNVQKIRGRITAQTYVEALQKFENGHANDQQLLNAVFYDKMKFANPVVYNFRYSMICQDKQRMEIFKLYGIEEKNLLNAPAIIHFTSWVAFGKPWDLYFEEDELKKYERGMIPGLPAHQSYVISKEQNQLVGIWWKYAKNTPVYEELYKAMTIKLDWYRRQVEGIVSRYYREATSNARQKNLYKQDFISINQEGEKERIYQGRVTESYEKLLIKKSSSNYNYYRYNLERNRRYLVKISDINANFDEYTAGVYDFINDRIMKYEVRSTKEESIFEFILGEHVEKLAFLIYAGLHRHTAGNELEVGNFTVVWEPLGVFQKQPFDV